MSATTSADLQAAAEHLTSTPELEQDCTTLLSLSRLRPAAAYRLYGTACPVVYNFVWTRSTKLDSPTPLGDKLS